MVPDGYPCLGGPHNGKFINSKATYIKIPHYENPMALFLEPNEVTPKGVMYVSTYRIGMASWGENYYAKVAKVWVHDSVPIEGVDRLFWLCCAEFEEVMKYKESI